MRRLNAKFNAGISPSAHRIVHLENLATEWLPDKRFLVPVTDETEANTVERLITSGMHNVSWTVSEGVSAGDVVLPMPAKGNLIVVYRDSDKHHSIFLTNRCNSYCLMCSQPPTTHDDSWLVNEAIDIVSHIKTSPITLGISGGEPLLLHDSLKVVINRITEHHPETRIEVLTNGRLFSQAHVSQSLLEGRDAPVSWLVPLYGHADFLHDYVVQSHGAYEETLEGLLVLQKYRQPIQLRIVLIQSVLQELVGLCTFIAHNLPFVREVALMACEPIGFALANKEECNVDLASWSDTLLAATKELDRREVPYIFMNTPLCALPKSLWHFSHQSISDWKNTYADECMDCIVKNKCSGLFSWHKNNWNPTSLKAIKDATHE